MIMTDNKTAKGEETKADPRRDLLRILKQDHEEALTLFRKIEESNKKEIRLFNQLEQELKIHLEGEERFFYTLVEQYQQARQVVLECYEEHFWTRTMWETFNTEALDEERWRAKIKVLREFVEHHMREEETQVFPLAAELLKKEELKTIFENYIALRSEHKKEQSINNV